MVSKILPHSIALVLLIRHSLAAVSVAAPNVSESGLHSYVLTCGASVEGSDTNGRRWVPDSKTVVIYGNSAAATAKYQDPSLPSQVPYMTARIFAAEANYTFSVLPAKRLWIRLHFNPSYYLGLQPGDAYFAVAANEITLLHNFSASLAAEALTQAYLVKEFSILPVETGDLRIAFTPCPHRSGSYAFVNGIEVIAMPDIFAGPPGGAAEKLRNSSAQTMFRLNVGGQYIPATSDSGLSRTWYNDLPYLLGSAAGVTMAAGKNLTIRYPRDVAEYVAPRGVYRSARSTGSEIDEEDYNLTWLFKVDANFTYVVRLHFCEIVEITKANQRVFDIFINNQTVELSADIFQWTGGVGVPAYKDFAAAIGGAGGIDEELRVALRPSETFSRSGDFFGAILNGLEIFKASDESGNLARFNPVPSKMLLADEAKQAREGSSAGLRDNAIGSIAGGVAGGAAGCAVVAAALFFAVYRNKKRMAGNRDESVPPNWLLPLYGSSYTSNVSGRSTSSHLSSLASLSRHFSLAEIHQGCNNFDETQVIGLGGFGKVYKGTVDRSINVAIKRSNPSAEQGFNEFLTEIEMLSKLRHKHLVSLIGFCAEAGEMILVYEYMANGTLREHVCNASKPTLTWQKRLEICVGAARGLHYLHTGANTAIIHRDVKTTNILLDENWEAKVSDFGLSKQGPSINQTHVSTMVKGSFGYLDPEYFRRQKLTDKSDVYSFGVVLFEVLCSRPALSSSLPREQVNLADWVLLCQSRGVLEEIVDQNLKEETNAKSFSKFVQTAEWCLADQGTDRPTMRDVVLNLEFALQLHDDPDASAVSSLGGGCAERKANDAGFVAAAAEGDEANSGAIFSQLVKPTGR